MKISKKRVTYRITVSMPDYVDKEIAKRLMFNHIKYDREMQDPFIQVMQIDPTGDSQKEEEKGQ